MALYRPRGPVSLQELDVNNVPGMGFTVCPDSIMIDPKVDRGSHTNKCGLEDVEDESWINGRSVDVTITFPTQTDKDLAIGVLGGQIIAATGTVTEEDLPNPTGGIKALQVYFLGGKNPHRNITSLSLHKDGSPTGPALVEDTDYTLDAETGKVTFLVDVAEVDGPVSAEYAYSDPARIGMLNAAEKAYALRGEIYNRQAGNRRGMLVLYKLRFDPAALDFMPENQQSLQIKGQALADTTRDVDADLGRFGYIDSIESTGA